MPVLPDRSAVREGGESARASSVREDGDEKAERLCLDRVLGLAEQVAFK